MTSSALDDQDLDLESSLQQVAARSARRRRAVELVRRCRNVVRSVLSARGLASAPEVTGALQRMLRQLERDLLVSASKAKAADARAAGVGARIGKAVIDAGLRKRGQRRPWQLTPFASADVGAEFLKRKAHSFIDAERSIALASVLEIVSALCRQANADGKSQAVWDASRGLEATKMFGSASPTRVQVVQRLLKYADELQHEVLGRFDQYRAEDHMLSLLLRPAWIIVLGRMHSDQFDDHFLPERFENTRIQRLPEKLLRIFAKQLAKQRAGNDVFTPAGRTQVARAMMSAFGADPRALSDTVFRYLTV